jgi:hypothetical protein
MAERDDRRKPVVTAVLGSAWFLSAAFHVLAIALAGLISLSVETSTDDACIIPFELNSPTFFGDAGDASSDGVGNTTIDGHESDGCGNKEDGLGINWSYIPPKCDGGYSRYLCEYYYTCEHCRRGFTCGAPDLARICQINAERTAETSRLWYIAKADADARAADSSRVQIHDIFDSLIGAGSSFDPSNDCPFVIDSIAGCGKPGAGLPGLWQERF